MSSDTPADPWRGLGAVLARRGISWGVTVNDPDTGTVVFEHAAHQVLDTASVGKLLLLAHVGSQLAQKPEQARVHLDRHAVAPVSDSGIWQHLDTDELTIADIARLIFISSDNLGTNVLLSHFGLERVRGFRGALGLTCTDLLDIVRDERQPGDPATLSRGTAAELGRFMTRVARGELVDPALSSWLRNGLSLNMDQSMVPAPLCLDPLARGPAPGGRQAAVANKTGTDAGVRADTGILWTGSRRWAYAAIANYDPAAVRVADVLAGMHSIGQAMLYELAR